MGRVVAKLSAHPRVSRAIFHRRVTILRELGTPDYVIGSRPSDGPKADPMQAIILGYCVGFDGEQHNVSRWPVNLEFLISADGGLVSCREHSP